MIAKSQIEEALLIPGLIDLDHTMMRVKNLPQARSAWQRLGFTTTPYRPNPSMGGGEAGGRGGNHLVIFTPQSPGTTNLIELAWADPDHAQPEVLAALTGDPGLAMLLHGADDIEMLRESWAQLGLSLSSEINHDGAYEDPETGQVDPVKYRAFLVDDEAWSYRLGGAQALDFAHYTRPSWQTHENGARYWKSVTLRVACDNLAQSADFLSRLYGSTAHMFGEHVAEVPVNHLSVRLVTAEGFAELHPASRRDNAAAPSGVTTGLKIVVEDLARTRNVLEANRVTQLAGASSIHIQPQDATGIAIEFVEDRKS